MHQGGCQCGKVRYEVSGELVHHALCHCGDCRLSAGAPMVAWLAVQESQLTLLSGELSTYEGKNGAVRQFCPICGTGLFYRNAVVLPGIADIQSVTLDDTAQLAPAAHIQCAERLPWMAKLDEMPEFERFPGG